MKLSALINSTNDLFMGMEIIELKNGFQNTVVKAKRNNETVYVKLYGQSESFSRESVVLQQMQYMGFAYPLLHAHYRDLLANVMSQVSGKPITKEDCQNGVLNKLVLSLKALHSWQSTIDSFDPVDRSKLYKKRIEGTDLLSTIEKIMALDVCKHIEETLSQVKLKTFVHGDLNASNVLYCSESQQIGFIDFERVQQDHPFADLARFSWRVLEHDMVLVRKFLTQYLDKEPNKQEMTLFNAYLALEYLGALSYYIYEGHSNGYPYKDEALNLLCQWPLLK